LNHQEHEGTRGTSVKRTFMIASRLVVNAFVRFGNAVDSATMADPDQPPRAISKGSTTNV
jgi:hypothetical protein